MTLRRAIFAISPRATRLPLEIFPPALSSFSLSPSLFLSSRVNVSLQFHFHSTLAARTLRRDPTRRAGIALRIVTCTYGAPLKDTPVCGPYYALEYPLIGVLTLASLAIFIARGLRVNALLRARFAHIPVVLILLVTRCLSSALEPGR